MNTITSPNYLKSGDVVGIIATARKMSSKDLTSSIRQLQDLGLKVEIGNSIDTEHHQFAGNDHNRASDLQNFLDDPTIKAIWCARGGYGTVRIIDHLDFTQFQRYPKWLIGYSDVTVLHTHLQTMGYASIHAPMAFDLTKASERSQKNFSEVLFGDLPEYEFAPVSDNCFGIAEGTLFGGNLSVIYSVLGSESLPKAVDNAILFLEDLDEYLYHLDRMLYNLKRNRFFDQINGVLIGGMTQMHDNTIPFGQTVQEIIRAAFNAYNIPIAFGFPAGHQRDNYPMIFGRRVRMEILEKGSTVTYL